jgi:AhpD family alkylhydroperoxidase
LSKKEKADRLLKKMKEERGYIYPEFEFEAKEDPDFLEAYNNLYRSVMVEEKALPIKYRELIAIALLAARGDEYSVAAHIKRAFAHGATQGEILCAIEVAMIPTGMPSMDSGLRPLMKILAERGEEKKTK